MSEGVHSILEAHACACNGEAIETLTNYWTPHTRCVCDGELVAEGREAVSSVLRREMGGQYGRVIDVDGAPAIVAYADAEQGGYPTAMVRVTTEADRVTEVRIEHPGR